MGVRDRSRWRAVLRRDAGADGAFVYAVTSTGIYCRPSCPSRRPRRDRTTFYSTSAAAEVAGFRPCRRCRPDKAEADVWPSRIRHACAYLASAGRPVSLSELAARVGGSAFHLQRRFTQLVGLSPREFADACRLRHVKASLARGEAITGAIVDAGYGSSSRFYERAAPLLGMTPSAYRRGGDGIVIHYVVVECRLGRLLVASTARGVCSVALGASDENLRRGLEREYPSARMLRGGRSLGRRAAALVAALDGPPRRSDIPIDVRATAFQWQVWNALAAIPPGERRTYTEIAAAVGRPGAARAVGRACASNPVALLVPCHRAVPAAGGIGGYRWGGWRKRAILAAERANGRARRM